LGRNGPWGRIPLQELDLGIRGKPAVHFAWRAKGEVPVEESERSSPMSDRKKEWGMWVPNHRIRPIYPGKNCFEIRADYFSTGKEAEVVSASDGGLVKEFRCGEVGSGRGSGILM